MRSNPSIFSNPKLISHVFCFGLMLFAVGISWSVFLVSNSVIILSLLIILKYDHTKNALALNNSLRGDLHSIVNTPLLFFMILFFVSVFISGIWSEDSKNWIWFSRMTLPFLLLPIAFFIHGRLSDAIWKMIFYLFIATTFCVSVFVLIHYLRNYEELNSSLLKGKSIVNHISHIRFSMMIALAAILSLHFSLHPGESARPVERWVFFPLLVYFFVINHVFSVKTGIVGMDLGLFAYVSIYFFKRKMYKTWLVTCGLLLLFIITAFLSFESLQNKINYTLLQIDEWKKGNWVYYSDIERWVSLVMGVEMIKQQPVFGSGIGDIYQVTKETYSRCLNSEMYKLPHNQFIFSWAFTGILSLISLLGMIYYSVCQKSWIKVPLIMGIQTVLLSSFLFEYTLQTQIGCNLYVFFTLMNWAYLRRN